MSDTINVNGIEYVKVGSSGVKNADGLEYLMVRTYSAGVWIGYLESEVGPDQIGVLLNARNIFWWDGACGLAQLSAEGTTKPDECKITITVPMVKLYQVIQILPVSEKAKNQFDGMPVWKQ